MTGIGASVDKPGPFERREIPFLAFATALAFLLRVVPSWSRAWAGGRFHFDQADGYYHLRRVFLLLAQGPAGATVDRYMAFPDGAECPWPPLYDGLAAAIAWFAGLGDPAPQAVEGAVAFLPPLFGAFTVVPVYLFCRRLAGIAAGRVAAAFLVAAPFHFAYSTIGSGDHHAADVFWFSSVLVLLLSAIESEAGGARDRRAAVAGLAFGSSILVWQGSVLYAVPLVGAATLLLFTGPGAESPARPTAIFLGTAAAVAAAGRAAWGGATAPSTFDFGAFSWFQPAFLLGGLAWILTADRARATLLRLEGRRRWVILLPIAALAGCLAPAFTGNLAAATDFILVRDPWLAAIAEFKPPFTREAFLPPDSPGALKAALGLAATLLPMVGAPLLFAARRRRGLPCGGAALLACCSLSLGALALLQARWENVHSVNVAVAAGLAFAWIRGEKAGGKDRGRTAIALATLLPFAVPSALAVRDGLPGSRPSTAAAFDATMSWVRANTPRTSGLAGGEPSPEYSVLAPWDLGHLVQYRAERPTVANNFGWFLPGGGLRDEMAAYFARDLEDVVEICRRRRVGFLIARDMTPFIEAFAGVAGIDFGREFMVDLEMPDGSLVRAPGPAYRDLPFTRLYARDGASRDDLHGLSHFRLVHEALQDSPGFAGEAERVKVFAFVEGAAVVGRASPGERVTLSCRLETDAGRTFEYSEFATADAGGRFAMRFPYSSEAVQGGTRLAGNPVLSTRAGGREVVIPESAVVSGAEVDAGGG